MLVVFHLGVGLNTRARGTKSGRTQNTRNANEQARSLQKLNHIGADFENALI